MRDLLLKWLINTLALVIVITLLPGIHVDRWETAALAALLLGFFNAFLKPALLFLTLPFNIMTLGSFTLFLNGFLFYLVSEILPGFSIDSFLWAFLGALLLSVISFVLNLFLNPAERVRLRVYRGGSFRKSRNADEDIIDVEGRAKDDDQHRKIT